MPFSSTRAQFEGHAGNTLAARLDLPAGEIRATAIFAHCFTCSKDLFAARAISRALAERGIAVLRFDFTGLGASEGAFADTTFTTNVQDLVRAADYLRKTIAAPALLIGHSLGGAAVLAAASDIPEATAVVTIGAPADAGHVLRQLGGSVDRIRDEGGADVSIAGRTFKVGRQFVEDVEGQRLKARIEHLGRALLVMHAPRDEIVGIENASEIFLAAKHPKSFISLDDADHLLSRERDAVYAADVVAAWSERYLPAVAPNVADVAHEAVIVTETGAGKFQTVVQAGKHRLLADEPRKVGGLDSGPSPYDYLSIALGACTAMTLRMYADFKKLELGRVSVEVRHGKVPADHCEDCGAAAEGHSGKIDRFERIITVEGATAPELRDKLTEIAGKCPVHRTLEASSAVVTRVKASQSGG